MSDSGPTPPRSSNTIAAALRSGAGERNAPSTAPRSEDVLTGEAEPANTDPGPENAVLLGINPDSNTPPFTDRGNPGPIWYSFDLVPKRVQPGGWTHQVTERELPTSKDIAGVNMRLTAGSFRELHWHTSDEWAIVLTGSARVSLLLPNGKLFIDDVKAGGLWYFPAGLPHSIQGLEDDGTEFLLVFNDGKFSEDDTFLLSEFLAHTPPDIVKKNMGWGRAEFDKLPATQLYIFPAEVPGPLDADKQFLGEHLETQGRFTFDLTGMQPTKVTSGGEVRIVDTSNFPVATGISGALVVLKPGAIREMHWHPNASEWQYWFQGRGRMTVATTSGKARTVDFRPSDVGYVPIMAGHSIENTGDEDVIFLEMFKGPRFEDISLNEWIARMPIKMAEAHLKLSAGIIRQAPQKKEPVLPS